MTRRNFTAKSKAAMFLRAEGRCEGMVDESGRYAGARGDTDPGWRRCGVPIGDGADWHADHIIPDALDGLNDAENGQCLCLACHGDKTGKRDAPAIAKARRMRQRNTGIKRQPKRGFRGWRNFSGEIVWKDSRDG